MENDKPEVCQDEIHASIIKRLNTVLDYPGELLMGSGEGLTLRDQFAMAALTGCMSDARSIAEGLREAARMCYAMADAMMEVRNGK